MIKILAQAPCVVEGMRARANSQMQARAPVLTSPRIQECWQKQKVTQSFKPRLVNFLRKGKGKFQTGFKNLVRSDVRALSQDTHHALSRVKRQLRQHLPDGWLVFGVLVL